MSIMAIFCIIPFVLMISVSFSSEAALVKGYKFWPKEFSMNAYSYLWLKRATILRAYGLTIFVTVVGTAANLILTSLFAYPLSRKDFKPRNVLAFILFFSLLFNGGMTSSYIIWTRLFGIKDTIWAYLLPGTLMAGKPSSQAATLAARFTERVITATEESSTFGIAFEPELGWLIAQL